jgi:hypothetical protein
MDQADRQTLARRWLFVRAAWASPLFEVLVAVVLWAWLINHQGNRGGRSTGVLAFYLALLVLSVLGVLVGLIALVGIRSWWDALVIVPGAILGLGLGSYNAIVCFLAHALEGKNLGG